LSEGFVTDVPVADEEGGQVIPTGTTSHMSPMFDCMLRQRFLANEPRSRPTMTAHQLQLSEACHPAGRPSFLTNFYRLRRSDLLSNQQPAIP
jgi:hypothetical protein